MAIQKKNRKTDVKRHVLLVFDDIFGSLKDSKVFKNLISTFRHYNISVIFSVQYVSATATYLREISQYIVVFDQRTLAALKLTYENYFQEFEKFTDFKAYFKHKLQKFHFFFIDREKNTKKIMICPSPKI